jgi:hypothetical protein
MHCVVLNRNGEIAARLDAGVILHDPNGHVTALTPPDAASTTNQ